MRLAQAAAAVIFGPTKNCGEVPFAVFLQGCGVDCLEQWPKLRVVSGSSCELIDECAHADLAP